MGPYLDYMGHFFWQQKCISLRVPFIVMDEETTARRMHIWDNEDIADKVQHILLRNYICNYRWLSRLSVGCQPELVVREGKTTEVLRLLEARPTRCCIPTTSSYGSQIPSGSIVLFLGSHMKKRKQDGCRFVYPARSKSENNPPGGVDRGHSHAVSSSIPADIDRDYSLYEEKITL